MANLLTILVPFIAIGSNGTRYNFRPYNQYNYIYNENTRSNIVTIDNEEFIVDDLYVGLCACKLDDTRTISEKRRDDDINRYFVGDINKEVLRVLGLDIKSGQHIDINGFQYSKLIPVECIEEDKIYKNTLVNKQTQEIISSPIIISSKAWTDGIMNEFTDGINNIFIY